MTARLQSPVPRCALVALATLALAVTSAEAQDYGPLDGFTTTTTTATKPAKPKPAKAAKGDAAAKQAAGKDPAAKAATPAAETKPADTKAAAPKSAQNRDVKAAQKPEAKAEAKPDAKTGAKADAKAVSKPADLAPAEKAGAQTSGRMLETGAIGPPIPPEIKSTPFADWILDCVESEGRKSCGLRQTVADAKGRRIAQITARHSGKTAYLEVIVPLGISIPYGVSLQLSDTQKLATQLADCDKGGCRAVTPLDDKAVTELKSAKALSIVFQDSRSGKLLKVDGSPKGFADGIGKVAAGG